ncbi:HAD-IIB family hydrolase [Staphylococcus warneri]|uniref:HAD-IIB family hydrolase n=1 Tax=Staphylococcus warneri TaxID=1292 RepID=UPI003260B098
MNFVFDIDGTISFDGYHVNPRIEERIFKLQQIGHQVIFASARPIRDLLPVIPNFEDFTLIGGNGSIVSQNGRIEVIKSIQPDDLQLIKDIIHAYQLKYILDDKYNYSTNLDASYELFQRIDPNHTAKNLGMDDIVQPIKAIILDIRQDDFEEIATILAEKSYSVELIHHLNEHYIDITAKGIDKHTTIQKLIGDLTEYIAFGNDHNDIQMLEHATQGYFVTNEHMDHTMFINNPNITLVENTNKAICKELDQFLK